MGDLWGSELARNILVMNRTPYVCVKCGANKKLTADHIVQLSQNGKNEISNLQWLCHSCHALKDKTHAEQCLVCAVERFERNTGVNSKRVEMSKDVELSKELNKNPELLANAFKREI